MAENKKGFVLYCDLIHTIKKLPDDKAGILFKHILSYVNDENPQTDDLIIDLAFEPIKQQLKRDLNKWEEIRTKRSESGKLGGLKRAELLKQNVANEANATFAKQNVANQAVIVTDKVTDKVTVKDTVTVKVTDKVINDIFIKIENSVWEKLTDEEKQQRIDIIKTEFKNSQEFKNTICQKYSFNVRIYDECQKKFFEMILLNDRFNDTFAELKKYFNNWINKNIDTLNPKNYLYR